MAWAKIPPENHPLFRDCLPRDPRVSTVNMFGGVAAKVNGQMIAGLFARGAVAKLSAPDQRAALAIDGATMFDPIPAQVMTLQDHRDRLDSSTIA